VAFKGPDRKYLPPISTQKRTKAEALQMAFQWLRDGTPKEGVHERESPGIERYGPENWSEGGDTS
jgi:hypothetical protein